MEWHRGVENKADFLSRYPGPTVGESFEGESQAFIFKVSDLGLPVTSLQMATATNRDVLLGKVLGRVQSGWPQKLCPADADLSSYFARRDELSVMCGVVMWGTRVVVPQCLRGKLLQELHEGHLGTSKMKSVARSFMRWPGLDKDIENISKSCESCMEVSNDPSATTSHSWLPTSRPYQRVHVDYAGPIGGCMLFVVVDSFSKWPEVVVTKSMTTENTIDMLRSLFARWGVPAELVSDNGPQFTSVEFQAFMAHLGIKHKRGAPYHPSTNGLAERFVQTVKGAFKASSADSGGVQCNLDRFLLAYRNASHSITGESPAQLMLGRPLRSRLDCVKPEVLSKQRQGPCPGSVVRGFGIGSSV